MGEQPAPSLTPEERALFLKGVGEFNRGYYFECHDTLEDLWAGLRGPCRDFFQGLIQISVAFYHLSNGNLAGCASMFARARKRFERYDGRYFGFDLDAQRREIDDWLLRIEGGHVPAAAAERLPQWRFEDPAR